MVHEALVARLLELGSGFFFFKKHAAKRRVSPHTSDGQDCFSGVQDQAHWSLSRAKDVEKPHSSNVKTMNQCIHGRSLQPVQVKMDINKSNVRFVLRSIVIPNRNMINTHPDTRK